MDDYIIRYVIYPRSYIYYLIIKILFNNIY